jgi:nucleotide-binding universal stress UspA family protein
MFDSILVPLDGSTIAEGVLPTVTRLARDLRIPVVPLRLVPSGVPVGGRAATGGLGEEEEQAHQYLSGIEVRLRAQGLETVTEVEVVERVPEGIVECAETIKAGLIAMSTHARSGVARWVLGSVADRVLRTAEVPVLLMRPREGAAEAPFHRLLVPLDRSEFAERALPYAAYLAARLNLPLTLLSVVVPPGLLYTPEPKSDGENPSLSVVTLREENDTIAYLDRKVADFRAHDFAVQPLLRFADPAEQIVRAAQLSAGTLVVMTTHGRSGLKRAFLGSVAETVVRQSGAPILLIRAQD